MSNSAQIPIYSAVERLFVAVEQLENADIAKENRALRAKIARLEQENAEISEKLEGYIAKIEQILADK
jgi:cell division protein FtsB